ncbi:hypothetical protein Fcan01_15072 [Folsomia candida]|uniref:Uncharacterized protein n=1 Tax=Folsomia candida TaxID=158441 RepID=A0A226DZJ9_FOLCA|nr:hypothetical protein Fcan01_15072 [Folsomia candida]
MDVNLDVIIDIPRHRQEIVVRDHVPPFCRVLKTIRLNEEGSRISNDKVYDSEVVTTLYKIARPELQLDEEEPFIRDLGRVSPEPPATSTDSTLSPAEEEIVVDMVKRAGDDGIEVGDSGRFLVWKDAAPRGFGQNVARVSEQLSLKKPNYVSVGVRGWNYPAVCTQAGCGSVNGTRVSEQNPTCLTHKGPNTGFAVIEYGTFDKNGQLTRMDHRILSFTYADGQMDEHLDLAIQRINRVDGQETRRLILDTREDAEKTLAVWQTAFLFQILRHPTLKYNSSTISLAIGLEREVKEELRRVGLELRLTMMLTNRSESEKIEFPFGRRAELGEQLSELITATEGALYVAADPKIMYGGQSILGNRAQLHNASQACDTIGKYKAEFNPNVKIIPLASVPKGVRSANLKKMESHLHVALYVAYLFRLRNHMDKELNLTHPHSLNKGTTISHFDANSRELIQRFVLKEFGAFIEILPCPHFQFII